eukprot:1968897-Ditylum_brightwellii.AAC.1
MLNQKEETCWAELVETTTFLHPTKNLMHGAFAVEDNHRRPMRRVQRKCCLKEDALERGHRPWQRGLKNLIA